MSWRDQPNASQVSARYAERKRAAQRSRDAAAPARTCNRCDARCIPGSIFCEPHASEYANLIATGASADECSEFCRRTHWPEAKP